MERHNRSSAVKDSRREFSEGCIHPEETRVWDPETGEVICGRCGEVISCEPVLVPKIKHNEKLQSHLNRTKLNVGTLPLEGKDRSGVEASNVIETLCFRLALPKPIKERAVVHAQKILKAARGAPHRVTLNESAVAGIICACRESGHPYSLKEIAKTVGVEPNDVYRLLARISRFYRLPHGVVPPEQYIRFISARVSARLRGEIDPHYLSLTERYAYSLLRRGRRLVSASPLHAAAEAFAAADERMADKIGRETVAKVVGAVPNGSFVKNIKRLKNSHVPPPLEAIDYVIQAFWED